MKLKPVEAITHHLSEIKELVESEDINLEAEYRDVYLAEKGRPTSLTNEQIMRFICAFEQEDPLDPVDRANAMEEFEKNPL